MIVSGEVSRGEKMLYSGTDPESYITEYTLIYEDKEAERWPDSDRISRVAFTFSRIPFSRASI